MRLACWINNATGTHLENVITIFLPQKYFLRKHFNIRTYVRTWTVFFLLGLGTPYGRKSTGCCYSNAEVIFPFLCVVLCINVRVHDIDTDTNLITIYR